MGELLYLKTNVVAEPLVDSWYAWAHLVSPATACMNIRNRHLPIMKSYVMAPQAHASAVKNPKMLGGPFIDYDGKRVDEIRELQQRTGTEHADLIGFAAAIEDLERTLKQEATGYSLLPLYEKIPAPLKGYTELVYDLNNNPSLRLKEAMLYKGPFYKEKMQSLQLYELHNDDRPFVFSTPRLPGPDRISLDLPFRSRAIDELFRMQRKAGDFEHISRLLNIPAAQKDLFRSLFTDQIPAPVHRYDGPYIRTRYFGHACILIETRDVSILVDPVISYEYDAEVSRYTFRDLPDEIDYVVITHNHQDHILMETMLQLRHKVKNIVVPRNGSGGLQDPSLRLMLKHTGFENLTELDELEEVSIPGGSIAGLPFFGEHGDLDIKAKLGYLVSLNGYSVLCLADSNNIEPRLYEHLHEIYGDVDVLFLGMECDGAPMSWLYGPYLPEKLDREKDQTRRLSGSDYQRGIDIVNRFNCREVYVYAMGQEPWIKYITSVKYTEESNPIVQSDRLIRECHSRGITAERLFGEKELIAGREIAV